MEGVKRHPINRCTIVQHPLERQDQSELRSGPLPIKDSWGSPLGKLISVFLLCGYSHTLRIPSLPQTYLKMLYFQPSSAGLKNMYVFSSAFQIIFWHGSIADSWLSFFIFVLTTCVLAS